MTEFVFGPYCMEVDVEAARAWYSRYGDATGVSVWFTTDMGPFLRDFPEPFFRCCISMVLPWILEEEL